MESKRATKRRSLFPSHLQEDAQRLYKSYGETFRYPLFYRTDTRESGADGISQTLPFRTLMS